MATFLGMPDGNDILISPITLPLPEGAEIIHHMRPAPRPRPAPQPQPAAPHHLRRFPPSLRRGTLCTHLGEPTGEVRTCQSCGGARNVAIRACAVHGECTADWALVHSGKRWPLCLSCADYLPTGAEAQPAPATPAVVASVAAAPPAPSPRPRLSWAIGLTTVPARRDTLLPDTLASLKSAGFTPTLFVDGCTFAEAAAYEDRFGLKVEANRTRLRTFGNWLLTLWRLYILQPEAQRYAIFQDDLLASANLRAYLETCPYPDKGYLNLYCFPENEALAPRDPNGNPRVGWYEGILLNTNDKNVPRPQMGLGAVGLVFSREAVWTLLGSRHIVIRPAGNPKRRHQATDGAVSWAMNGLGWREYVHWPSLLQHTGDRSTMGHKRFPQATSFRGADFDCLRLLPGR